MKKCPNCNKPVPVGARRCVHCRMPIEDIDQAIPRTQSYDNFASAGAGFGRANNVDPIDNGMYRSGGRMGPGAASGGHHTMIGLGPIESNPRQGNDIFDTGEQRTVNTIAGMPGVSANMTRQQLMEAEQAYRSSSTPSMNAISGSFNPARTSGIKEPLDLPDFSAPTRSSGSRRPVSNSAPIPASLSANVDPVLTFKPSISTNDAKPVPAASNPPASTTAPSGASVQSNNTDNNNKPNEDDPLAGLSGVSAAPVPSSLVDEEFTDLTSKLFGEDFADINETPVDEDGWDFDFDTPAEEPEKPEPVQEIKKTEPVVPAPLNISSTDFKKIEKEPKPEAPKAEDKPKEEPKTEETPKTEPQKAATTAPAKQQGNTNIIIAAVCAVLAVGLIAVIKVASLEGAARIAAFIVAVGMLACAGFFFIKKKN